MRLVVAVGCLMGLLAWAQAVLAQQPVPGQQVAAARPAFPDLPPGWQRIDAHTLRRVDIANAASRWQRVDAHRWHLLAPGEEARTLAMR